MSRYKAPKSSGRAIVSCIISILIGVVILGIAYYGWVGPWIEHKDWVEVEVHQQDLDCTMGTCYGNKGRRYSCPKCTVEYEYAYKGETYKGKSYYAPPTEGKSKKALINPKLHAAQEPYDSPGVGLFLLEVFLALLAFGFAFMFGGLSRSYRKLEDAGREDLIQKIANGEDIDEFSEDMDEAQSYEANRRLGPPKPKYKR